MPFKIVCSCGIALLANDDLSGLKVACPECGSYTSLPGVPDPYRLPTNAEMIPLEVLEEHKDTRNKIKAATVRRKDGGVQRAARPVRAREPREMSSTDVILIICLVIVGVVILVLLFAYAL